MKATGIIRGVDNLGRIVIPKEIRKSMGLKEGTKLELFTDGTQLIYRKYTFMDTWKEAIFNMANPLAQNFRCNIMVIDKDSVVMAAGKDLSELLIGEKISDHLKEIILSEQEYSSRRDETYVSLFCYSSFEPVFKTQFIKPFMNGDNKAMGAVIVLHTDRCYQAYDVSANIANTVAEFIETSRNQANVQMA